MKSEHGIMSYKDSKFKDVRGMNSFASECMGTRDDEHSHDEAGLQNHCALLVIGIGTRHHEIRV